MEPKPRGLTSIDLSLKQPDWLVKAAQIYQSTPDKYSETSFLRGGQSMEILDRIMPETTHKPNILLVGLGLDFEPLICSYVPFRIAAHLESQGLDYQMTLVDANADVIEDVRGRTRLFLAYRQFVKEVSEAYEQAWKKYLADTKQEGAEIFTKEDGLVFSPGLENTDSWYSYTSYLKYGIGVADVSPQFRTKLTSGDIRLIHDDIAVANLGNPNQFDYVDCVNVLYLLPQEGQQLALANISRSMINGGRLLVNDIGYTGTPLFTRLGGWLDDEKLQQLGLEVEELMYVKKNSQEALLRKTV